MIPIRDNLSCKSPALATRALIILNFLAFVVQTFMPEAHQEWFFKTFCVVPNTITQSFLTLDWAGMGLGLVSMLTATFLHGGVAHILGNMLFLNAFGKSVENRLGSWRFVGFYLLGGFAAWGYHFLIDPFSTTMALGASGAIAAVLGMYLLFYPRAEFMTFMMAGPYPMLVNIRAYWFLPIWFLGQLTPGISELLRPSVGAGIAYWAHIGGFAAGLAMAAYWVMRRPVSDVCYSPFVCRCGHDDCHKNGFSFSNLFRRSNRRSDCEHGCDTSNDDKQRQGRDAADTADGGNGNGDGANASVNQSELAELLPESDSGESTQVSGNEGKPDKSEEQPPK